jgi:hypothetical protein
MSLPRSQVIPAILGPRSAGALKFNREGAGR